MSVWLARRFRRFGALGVAAVLAGLLPGTATAGSVDEDSCRGITAQIPVPVANVDPLVPDDDVLQDFTITQDPLTGKATAAVGAVQCDLVTVGGSKRPKTEFVTFRVTIDDPDPFDPPQPGYIDGGHAYTVWFASDNRDMVEYYRQQGDVSEGAAVYDDGISIKMPAEGESGELKVSAPAAPSPFKMQARVESFEFGPLPVSVDFWAKVATGTMVQRPDLLDELQLGDVRAGELKPALGSEMDRVFCGLDRTRQGAVRFSGDVGQAGPSSNGDSFRLFFRDGLFTVGVDTNRKPTSTDTVTCPPAT